MYLRFPLLKIFQSVFFFSSLIASHLASAQAGYEDVLYLKNGSIIYGQITGTVQEDSISIETGDGNIFMYKMDQVLKITKEEKFVKAPAPTPKKEILPRKKRGFMHMSEWLISITYKPIPDYSATHFDEINNTISLGYQTINGYQFNPWFSIGGGVGIHQYNYLYLVPLFLDLQFNFFTTRLTPFWDVEAGWSFAIDDPPVRNTWNKDDGGPMGSASFGLKYYVTPINAINLCIGFHYQEFGIVDNYYDSGGNFTIYSTKSTNRIIFRTGFTF